MHKKVLEYIEEVRIRCNTRYKAHLKAALNYRKRYIRSTIPILILSAVTTLLTGISVKLESFGVGLAATIVSSLVLMGNSIAAFLEYNNKFNDHFTCANKYINLARYIETKVYGNYELFASGSGEEFAKQMLSDVEKEMIAIQDIEPCIPLVIEKKNDQILFEEIKSNSDNDIV